MASLTERPLIALVGGDTLLAKEIREVLGESKPAPRVQLISASGDGTAKLAAEDEEPIVMAPLRPRVWRERRSRFWPARPPPAAGRSR